MARKRTSLVRKEEFINQMIFDSIKHTHGFNVFAISNGKYDFGDIDDFLKKHNLANEFKEFLEERIERRGIEIGETHFDEVSKDDLPFAEKDFFKNKSKT